MYKEQKTNREIVFKCGFKNIIDYDRVIESTGEVHCNIANYELAINEDVQVTINASTGHVVLNTGEYGYFHTERVNFNTRVWIRIGRYQKLNKYQFENQSNDDSC